MDPYLNLKVTLQFKHFKQVMQHFHKLASIVLNLMDYFAKMILDIYHMHQLYYLQEIGIIQQYYIKEI